MKKTFEIWSEGYVVMEGRGTAHHHGNIEANSFKEACDIFFNNNKLYSPERLTYWECKLFDNETDARKAFG